MTMETDVGREMATEFKADALKAIAGTCRILTGQLTRQAQASFKSKAGLKVALMFQRDANRFGALASAIDDVLGSN